MSKVSYLTRLDSKFQILIPAYFPGQKNPKSSHELVNNLNLKFNCPTGRFLYHSRWPFSDVSSNIGYYVYLALTLKYR